MAMNCRSVCQENAYVVQHPGFLYKLNIDFEFRVHGGGFQRLFSNKPTVCNEQIAKFWIAVIIFVYDVARVHFYWFWLRSYAIRTDFNAGFISKFVILPKITTNMQKSILTPICAMMIATVMSCGGKTSNPTLKSDSTEISFSNGDSVETGYAGSECTDSVLDFIKPGEDPQHYNIVQARKRGTIIGNFETGDQVAIVLSEDRKRVVRAIDISSLIGRWLTGDSIGDPAATGFTLGEDGYAGTIAHEPERIRYKSWDIKSAKLVLTKCDAMLARPVMLYDTFNIVSLEQDTLFLRPEGSRQKTKYVKSVIEK